MIFKLKTEVLPASIYFIISFVAYIFVMFTTTKSALSGVYIVLLTLPWSFISVVILDYIHFSSIILSLILTAVYIIINTVILFLICNYLKK